MDVTETAHGDQYVLRQYLDMAVYFGPLAEQASSCPGGDILDSPFQIYLEAMRRQVTGMPGWAGDQISASGGPWPPAAKRTCGRVTNEVQNADFLCDDLQTWA